LATFLEVKLRFKSGKILVSCALNLSKCWLGYISLKMTQAADIFWLLFAVKLRFKSGKILVSCALNLAKCWLGYISLKMTQAADIFWLLFCSKVAFKIWQNFCKLRFKSGKIFVSCALNLAKCWLGYISLKMTQAADIFWLLFCSKVAF
jgi:hypothetical protein